MPSSNAKQSSAYGSSVFNDSTARKNKDLAMTGTFKQDDLNQSINFGKDMTTTQHGKASFLNSKSPVTPAGVG